jgi:hypothetical protein
LPAEPSAGFGTSRGIEGHHCRGIRGGGADSATGKCGCRVGSCAPLVRARSRSSLGRWNVAAAPLSHWHLALGLLAPSSLETGLRTILLLLVSGDLGGLDSADLAKPGSTGLGLADGTELVRGEARDSDVVDTLKDQLNVTDLKHLGAALLGKSTGTVKDIVDEVVSNLQDRL